ncbi:helix-turn-helix domain-containing protein [Candidatus Uhrbacteria bacterium]|nr:helix-turn-helix domain-containing protein [Candidatus Uhrbacteria bacterium]
MLEEIKRSLAECGLSQKEASVYLAMLELGEASVQDIAEKAGVNRSTTYLMIESLQRRGLVSQFEDGAKTQLVAENPERLIASVVDELAGVEAKKQKLHEALPHLLAMFRSGDKPIVRYFEGEESLGMVRQEIGQTREPIWEVYAVDEDLIAGANTKGEERIQITKRLTGRAMMAIKPGCIPPYFDRRGFEVREIGYDTCPFSGDIVITGEKLFVFTSAPRGLGVIVESKEIVDIVRALYDAAWKTAKLWNPPEGWGK